MKFRKSKVNILWLTLDGGGGRAGNLEARGGRYTLVLATMMVVRLELSQVIREGWLEKRALSQCQGAELLLLASCKNQNITFNMCILQYYTFRSCYCLIQRIPTSFVPTARKLTHSQETKESRAKIKINVLAYGEQAVCVGLQRVNTSTVLSMHVSFILLRMLITAHSTWIKMILFEFLAYWNAVILIAQFSTHLKIKLCACFY